MGKFTGVLLASDFDNTLIYTEDALRAGAPAPPLPEQNREALTYFMAQGGRFAISTGRALAAFLKYAELVPMNAPGVVCNGAALYDFETGEYLETSLLDQSALERGQAVLDRFPAAVEAYHIGNVIHAVHPNAFTRPVWRSPRPPASSRSPCPWGSSSLRRSTTRWRRSWPFCRSGAGTGTTS